MTGKEFTLKYEFTDVGELREFQYPYSPEEEHFGVKWKIGIQKVGNLLRVYLFGNATENLLIDCTAKIILKNREKSSTYWSQVLKASGRCICSYNFDWKTIKMKYLNDGKLKVIVHAKMNTTVGFPIEMVPLTRRELRSFGEETKQFSDVVLKVDDRKFYVSKLYLSSQSPYFATLFLGAFQESGKSEIELKDIDPQDFQCYLEVLYGENGIDEDSVEGILEVSDMYDTPLSVKKCEEFLIEKSKMELKKMLELAGKYRLDELKKTCLNQIKTIADIRAVIPKDSSEMDHGILAKLFDKLLELH
ncbi:unnamed protein product [Caenorhabditis nigoni]